MKFEYEYYRTQEEVRQHIRKCEGEHTQQVAYSTYHKLFAISVAQRREGTRRFYAYVGIRIPPEPTPLPNIPSTPQTTLKTPLERTESNLREQAPAPQPKLCRVCRSSTSTLVHDPRGEGVICIDCLNEYQRRNEEE